MKNYHSSTKMKGLRTMMNELFPVNDKAIRQAWKVLAKNVDRGEKFLDKERPGWYKKVNRFDLDMEQDNKCICGWVFNDMVLTMVGDLPVTSDYEYFSLKHVSSLNGPNYGFLSDSSQLPNVSIAKQYSILTELWVEKIEKRLADDGLLGT